MFKPKVDAKSKEDPILCTFENEEQKIFTAKTVQNPDMDSLEHTAQVTNEDLLSYSLDKTLQPQTGIADPSFRKDDSRL